MTVADALPSPFSDSAHRIQLRRAVIASTVGTTIEWYDFFLYSAVTGLVFGKLFFPKSDPLVGVLASLRHLFVRLHRAPDRRGDLRPLRRPHRPQGDADRHPADHRHRDLRGRLGADLRPDRHLGRGHPDRSSASSRASASAANGAARCCCRWNGRAPTSIAASSRPGRSSAAAAASLLANLAVLVFSRISGDQFLVWGWRVPFLLSIVMVGVGLYIRLGVTRDPDLQRAAGGEPDRARAGPGGDQAPAEAR